MYILGLNGWDKRGHDASACLIKNGKILAAAEEERFIRQKHAFDKLPHNSVKFCLEEGKINLDEVSIVAIGWNLPKLYRLRKIPFNYNNEELAEKFFPKKMFKYSRTPNFAFVDHHLAHASSVFRTSGFKEASILIIDGQGENSSTSLYHGKGNKIKLIRTFDISNSMGYFYDGLTAFVGISWNAPGKTMGLSSFGKIDKRFENLVKLIPEGYILPTTNKIKYENGEYDEEKQLLDIWARALKKTFGNKNRISKEFNKKIKRYVYTTKFREVYRDVAASGQKAFEDLVSHLTKTIINETRCRNLCISGGCALNSLSNGKLLNSGLVKNLFVHPASDDSGTSLGAALEVYSRYKKSKLKMEHSYFGPSFSNEEIESELKKHDLDYHKSSDIEKDIAILLSRGKVIGNFQGKMEWGPRALGNRSILANPTRIEYKDKTNKKVKYREPWRPFGPSILNEKRSEFFTKDYESPFMTFTFDVKKNKAERIPAVVHIDGTTRPQTVRKRINRRYWEIIKNFYSLTGIPLVLNTSLNIKGDPLVCTPKDAINTLLLSDLDYLALGDYLVRRH